MRLVRLLLTLVFVNVVLASGALPARAADARPWLCRDKPVFSSKAAMSYQVTSRGGSRWGMLLMQFQPGTAHDGFEVVASQDVPADAKDVDGNLAPGQYFAVAMYRGAEGRWICPDYARHKDRPSPGALGDICFGDDPQSCLVTLTVRPAALDAGSAITR